MHFRIQLISLDMKTAVYTTIAGQKAEYTFLPCSWLNPN